MNLRQQVNLCARGCRRPTKTGNMFINGHNSRVLSDAVRKRMGDKARAKVGALAPNWKGGNSDSYRRRIKIR